MQYDNKNQNQQQNLKREAARKELKGEIIATICLLGAEIFTMAVGSIISSSLLSMVGIILFWITFVPFVASIKYYKEFDKNYEDIQKASKYVTSDHIFESNYDEME